MDSILTRKFPNDFAQWLEYVNQFADSFAHGARIQPSFDEVEQGPVKPFATRKHKLLICSPHPDDEALTGALPLRLSQEDDVTVCNMAITLGSDPARKEARKHELQAACEVLGFDLLMMCEPLAFDGVTALTRGQDPTGWQTMVEILSEHLIDCQPDMILFPHARDSHSTHVGVHFLVLSALQTVAKGINKDITVVETEFWHALESPNLLVESNQMMLLY